MNYLLQYLFVSRLMSVFLHVALDVHFLSEEFHCAVNDLLHRLCVSKLISVFVHFVLKEFHCTVNHLLHYLCVSKLISVFVHSLKPKRSVLVSTPANSTSMPAISETQPTDSLPPTHPPQSTSTATEVIEVSDIEEPVPAPRREKAKAAATLLDVAEESAQARPTTGENLKFSPNTMEVIAAATAAAVAAAVSSPKGETHPSLGERRPHLMSEILKRPGGVDPAAAAPCPKSITPSGAKTPPTPLNPQGKEPTVSPFLAEFNRYLYSSNSSSQPSTSSRMGQPLTASQASQLQSKTVSSSTGRADDKKTSQQAPIQWQMEGWLGDDKSRRLSQGAASLPSGVHTAHKVAPPPGSASLDPGSAQRAHYQKMTALLMGHDSPPPLKSKGDIVRDQILSRIEAEIASSKAAKSSTSSKQSGDFSGKKTAPVAQASVRPSSFASTAGLSKQSPIFTHPSRQSPLPAHSPGSQRSSGTVPVSRPPSSVVSQQSPTAEIPRSAMVASSKQQAVVSRHSPPTVPRQSAAVVSRHMSTAVPRQSATVVSTKQQAQPSPPAMPRQSPTVASSKQQAVVSPRQVVPPGNSQGPGVLPRGVSSRSLLSTFQSQQPTPSQLSPPSARSAGPVRPVSDPTQRKPVPSPSSVSAAPASAHSALPFQRSPTTPTSQPPVKVSASQGQSMKVTAASGQTRPHQPVSAGLSLLRKSSPTNLTSQGQRNTVAQPLSNNTDKSQRGPSPPKGSQKLPGGATSSAGAGLFQGLALSQSLYHQIEREAKKQVQNNRLVLFVIFKMVLLTLVVMVTDIFSHEKSDSSFC